MVDVVSKKVRSRMMSGIRSSNTKPEVLTRNALHRLGYRFRLDSKIGKIKPDIVLRRLKVAIFIHGCYWHQHKGCKLAYSDRSYSDKWLDKFEANRERDKKIEKKLHENGWRVAIIWECATRKKLFFVMWLINWLTGCSLILSSMNQVTEKNRGVFQLNGFQYHVVAAIMVLRRTV